MLNAPPILVTRPNHQADELIQRLEAKGLSVMHQPIIDIQPLDETAAIKRIFLDLDHYQGIIAISANAARLGSQWLDRYWPQTPIGIQWFAIGQSTAKVLAKDGIDALMPRTSQDSEGLLARPELSSDHVEGSKFLIWRGQGGREHLYSVLTSKGAKVDCVDLYRREFHRYSKSHWQSVLKLRPILVISSGQALEALLDQIPEAPSKIRALVVPSQRIKALWSQLTHNNDVPIWVAQSAQDEDTVGVIEARLPTLK